MRRVAVAPRGTSGYADMRTKLNRAAEERQGTMPDGLETPPADQPAPETDSPASAQGDSAENSPQATEKNEGQDRVRAAQAELHRKAKENADLKREAAELREQLAQQATPEGTEQPKTSSEVQRLRQQLEEANWARAEAVYGPEVVQAYEQTRQLLAADQSPMGWLAALETYHAARSQGATPAQAQGAPTRAQAVAPRVDSNRSDASPDQLQAQLEQARKVGGSRGLAQWLNAGGGGPQG